MGLTVSEAVASRRSVRDFLPDPVPQAMVLTGIVVAVAATALALALVRKLHALSGRLELPDDVDE